jgi:hypothetical protein
MSVTVPRRLALALLALAMLIASGGFISGALSGKDAPRQGTSDGADAIAPSPRDPSLALRTLDTHGHWGRYTPRAEQASAVATTRSVVSADALAQAYRLVGIEHQDGLPQAFLLPVDAADGSTELIRLRTGDTLGEGISVSAIGHDSVRFTTPGGSSTLNLYGSEP